MSVNILLQPQIVLKFCECENNIRFAALSVAVKYSRNISNYRQKENYFCYDLTRKRYLLLGFL